MSHPSDALIDAMKTEFTDTELHALIIAADKPENRDMEYWQKLRRAAIKAAGCNRH